MPRIDFILLHSNQVRCFDSAFKYFDINLRLLTAEIYAPYYGQFIFLSSGHQAFTKLFS